MKTTVIVSIIIVLLCAGALWIAARSRDVAVAGQEARAAALEVELQALRTAHANSLEVLRRLEARVAGLEEPRRAGAERGGSSAVKGRLEAEEPAAAIAGGAGQPDGAEASPAAARDASHDEKLQAALEKLFDPATSPGERQALWSRLAKDGLLDGAIAAFEVRLEEEPRNPDRHAELGNAYVQKILTVGDAEKGTWAQKADRAFDAALGLDDRHWDARFTKAASLSFWPPLFGKQAEAAKHFEVLIEQQEAQASQEKFASTYLFLGNLYQNQGNAAKAQEVWKHGAELFPRNEELGKKVEGAGER